MREFFSEAGWMDVIIAVFVMFIVLVVVNIITATGQTVTGVVVSRAYTPSQTSTGVGVGPSSSGGTTTVITTSTTDEEWDLIVRVGDRVEKATTTPTRWANAQPGDIVTVTESYGGIAHDQLGCEVQ